MDQVEDPPLDRNHLAAVSEFEPKRIEFEITGEAYAHSEAALVVRTWVLAAHIWRLSIGRPVGIKMSSRRLIGWPEGAVTRRNWNRELKKN